MHRWWAIPAVAALWTGLERTHGPFGFAWLHLGNAGIDMPVPMRLAPYLGVYGLSFVFAMFGCAVALVILQRPRRELAWLLALPLLLLLPAAPAPETAISTRCWCSRISTRRWTGPPRPGATWNANWRFCRILRPGI